MLVDRLPDIPGYQISELIHQSDRTLVYRGWHTDSEQPVIIKLMRNEYPCFNELVQFRNQYALARTLEIEGTISTIDLKRYENRYALIMEDMGGISLADYHKNKTLSIGQFLEIAIQLADILHHLHHSNVIHKDIKPVNILIHPETKKIKLIDFSISTLLPKETQNVQTPNVLQGTLAYLSPEQTGRMNRGIDYRSDFYSLGVTFYELLAGELPFLADDPLEIVHCHIAKAPPLINRQSPIPGTVVDIVMKLMAKNAEDRYQSALGLKYDLEKCLVQYREAGKIAPFALGERDICDRFLIPEKLYGREKEVKTLLKAFNRIAEGNSEMMLVAGFSGIGKTAVINEVHKPIVNNRGYFIKGKFDQFNRDIPFSAFVIAFRDLMGQLLGESDAELQEWKAKILKAVGEGGQVLTEVIPELERIIGEQPPVPELSGSAAQNRFNLLFEKFIAVFTTKKHPLTLFLDDLQWADSASLNLLKVLIGDNRMGYLLLLGAYRDNEVFPAHPLMLTLAELKKRDDLPEWADFSDRDALQTAKEQKTTISTLTLAPLSVAHVNQLVAATLSCSVELARPLTDLVHQKTKGNPFFTTQFLKGLYEDRLIILNPNLGYWEFDLVKVRDELLTDDVVEFMAGRLHKLPEGTRKVLKLAACIGNQFDLETLAITCEMLSEKVAAALWSALQEGLILPQSEAYKFFQEWKQEDGRVEGVVSYRFLHDRVQQAAYALIPEEKKPEHHLKIGQLLWNNTPESQQEKVLFDIVGQMNLGATAIAEQEERDRLATLNWQVAQKAKSATAYKAMFDYCLQGYELLGEGAWERNYPTALNLATGITEAAYLQSHFSTMENWLEEAMSHAISPLDRVKLYEIIIQSSMMRGQFSKSLEAGLELLALFGIEFPESPSQEDMQQALAQTAQLCEQYTFAEILNLPEIEDEVKIATLRILCLLFAPASNANPTLAPLIVTKQMNFCLQHGNSNFSASAYLNYGLLLGNIVEDLDGAYRFGRLGLDYQERSWDRTLKAKILMTFLTFISLWHEPLRDSLELYLECYAAGLEVGDFESAVFASAGYCCIFLLTGNTLSEYIEKLEVYGAFTRQISLDLVLVQFEILLQFGLNLLGESSQPHCLTGQAYDWETRLPQHYETNSIGAIMTCQTMRIWLSVLFDRPEDAIAYAEATEPYFISLKSVAFYPVFRYYEALARLAIWEDADGETRSKIEKRVRDIQTQFSAWAARAPMNYQHKWELIEAEKQRVLGDRLAAIDAYDRAIAGAKENGYIQEEALSNELFAKFYLNWRREKEASVYMQQAYYCYAQWEAKAKTDDLEKRYPQLLSPILQQQPSNLTANSTITNFAKGRIISTNASTGELLDLASLMKASRSLCEEIDLDRAIANFMQVIQENAGAETVALMLFEENTLMLVAHATGEDMSVASIPVETSDRIPLTLIHSVKNTHEPLVLDNAKEAKDYAGDTYIQKYQPQSVFCLPLIDRGQLIGILYLENNQVSGAFTRDRIEILNLLCSQAAIALQNAQLYDTEQQARNDLQQVLTDLQEAQLQLVQSEKMATLGNLVAGVAHEINNPVGFISGNVRVAQEYLQDLLDILSLYEENTSPSEEIAEEIEEINPDFIREDFPKLIESMQGGCDRIAKISTSLRTFSRTDTDKKTEFNLHKGLDSTLLILKYRLKANGERPAIRILKDYGEIPEVKCYAGQINQVFMNLLANAIDALDESNEGKTDEEIESAPNCITISTKLSIDRKSVVVTIIDNGMGMSEEVKAKIFEQGFTTKMVGKGTGLGMTISQQIIVEKHRGSIACTSELGQGTEFMISLPLN
ncbi:AAA family ATPase [Roseofilum sp. Belize Diploria]|uniref:trifunctional serine/threonine-protein kinase/ATP-binding protein/sensor histidine kinase n=1 Tax=Roseofilum sp. Belize Diploria TaxID=2821501 RepID=UPI001B2CEE56|nr:AAA family ATPase [Roseofilum sp. Belize Diploria]MBP0009221.1 AAA family ATPase [Roseofilum sp. Belize Diploria]